VELETEKQAADLRVQVQLAKIRDGFKPKNFAGDWYYVLKDFVPTSMQLLLLREAEGLLEKSNEEPTHILYCRKQVTMQYLPYDQQSKMVTGNWEKGDAICGLLYCRVKTKEGLFLRQHLSKVLEKYAVPAALLKMLDKLRERAPTYWDEDDYSEMFG